MKGERLKNKNNANDVIKLLATGFYTGYSPYAPGTAGTILAMLLYLILPSSPAFYWLILIVLVAGGTVVSGKAEKMYGKKDSSCIVIDEICGYFITMAFLPKSLPLMILGFAVFRFLDIFKLPFIRRLEDVKGGLGIMLDDIAAGMIGSVILHLINLFDIVVL